MDEQAKRKRSRYSDEFKREAVRLVVEEGYSFRAATGLPHTQVAVALAFLKERGSVVVEGRRCFPARDPLYDDGVLEYHALRELPERA